MGHTIRGLSNINVNYADEIKNDYVIVTWKKLVNKNKSFAAEHTN